jgi:hypothetical protein
MQLSKPVKNKRDAGYFLTDALVAVTVLGVAGLGALAAFDAADRRGNHAEKAAYGLVVAKACIESLDSRSYDETVELETTSLRQVRTIEPFSRTGEDQNRLRRIVCVASWREGQTDREVRLERLVLQARLS